MGSDLGETYDPLELSGFCFSSVANGPYSYPAACNPATSLAEPQEGPEHVYTFTCTAAGDVNIELTGMDCDLDLYVLDDQCLEQVCIDGSNRSSNTDEDVTLTCGAAGETYYLSLIHI